MKQTYIVVREELFDNEMRYLPIIAENENEAIKKYIDNHCKNYKQGPGLSWNNCYFMVFSPDEFAKYYEEDDSFDMNNLRRYKLTYKLERIY